MKHLLIPNQNDPNIHTSSKDTAPQLTPCGCNVAEVMADATLTNVLYGVEKLSSFASSISPIFGIVSSLVGLVRKSLLGEEVNALDERFQEIQTKLESICQKNQQRLSDIQIQEVNETYNKYENCIKHQYIAFNNMVANVKKNPGEAKRFMEEFKDSYEGDKSDMSLNTYYQGVMGQQRVFGTGTPLLEVCLKSCNYNREVMEQRCSRIAHLFHTGLIALVAYTAITKDDVDEVQEEWKGRLHKIKEKMQEGISRCEQPDKST